MAKAILPGRLDRPRTHEHSNRRFTADQHEGSTHGGRLRTIEDADREVVEKLAEILELRCCGSPGDCDA
jgi:hypothetical protein